MSGNLKQFATESHTEKSILQLLRNSSTLQQLEMKILQIAQENVSIIGIDANQSTQKFPLNTRNSLVLFTLCSVLASDLMYLIYDANDFKDYAVAILASCTMIVSILVFAYILVKMRIIFDFLHRLEEIINNS